MVRLMLTLTPVVCVLSAIAFSECFSYCLHDEDDKPKSNRTRYLNPSDGVNADYHSTDEGEDSSDSSAEKKQVQQRPLYDKVCFLFLLIFFI